MPLAQDIQDGLETLESLFPPEALTEDVNAVFTDLKGAAQKVGDAEIAKAAPAIFSGEIKDVFNEALDDFAAKVQSAADAKIASVNAAKAALAATPPAS
jgi:hypothetical protein